MNTPFDALKFKREFPLFDQPENKDLIYLDNGATTQKPKIVLDTMQDYYLYSNANAHRSSHRLARSATAIQENARKSLAAFIHAKPEEIIFCRGTTEGFNLLATILSSEINAGDEIILSRSEHHANLLPWWNLAKLKNAQIRYLPDIQGRPDLSALPELLNDRTKIVSLAIASNVLGCQQDLLSIANLMKDHPCFYCIDAAQGLAHIPLDVNALGCDFLVASAHKAYGPLGTGVLFGRFEILSKLNPWQFGGEMVQSVSFDKVEYALPPNRFEAGTMSLCDIAGFGAAIRFIQQQDRAAMQHHEHHLVRYLHQALQHDALHLLSQGEHNVGICTFNLASDQLSGNMSDLALWLDEHDVAVRVGYHCAQPLYQHLGVKQGLRISVTAYNTLKDCEKAVELVQQWLEDNTNCRSSSLPSVNMSQEEKLAPLFETKNWQDRYKILMELGNQPVRCEIQRHEHLIHGCEAKIWLKVERQDQNFQIQIDSESRILRGLSQLILYWFDGKSAEEILAFDWKTEAQNLGLSRHLSASRNNGFRAIIEDLQGHVKSQRMNPLTA